MPSTAEVFLRLRVDPSQVKRDVDSGLKGVNTKAAGKRAGDDFGIDFSKAVKPKVAGAFEDIAKQAPVKLGPAGTRAGDEFGSGFRKSSDRSAPKTAESFVQKLSNGISIKRAAIGAAITAALAVGPVAIAGAGAAIGVGVAAAAGAAIYKSLSTQLKAATKNLTAAQKAQQTADQAKAQLGIAVLQLKQAEKSGNAARIASAKLRVQTLQAAAAQGTAAAASEAAARKQVAALQAQLAQYDKVKSALSDLKKTAIDVGNRALVSSGILGQFSNALTGIGVWLRANQGKFTDFFKAAAPYVGVFTAYFEQLVNIVLPIFTRLMQQALPAVIRMLDSFNGFVQSGVGGFFAQIGKNAGVSAQAFGILLNQLAPLLPLLGSLAGIAARLIVAFPQLVPVIIGLSVGFKGLLVITSVVKAFQGLSEATKAIKEFNLASKLAAAGPWVLLAVAVVAAAILIYKNWGPISRFFIRLWGEIFSGFIRPLVNFFTQTIPHAFGVVTHALSGGWGGVVSAWQSVVRFFSGTVGAITGVFNKIRQFITSSFTTWWRANGQAIETIWFGLWNTVKAVFGPIWNAVVTIVKAGWTVIVAVFRGEVTATVGLVKALWTVIEGTFKLGAAIVSAVWKVLWAAVSAYFRLVWAEVQAIAKTGWAVIQAVFKTAMAAVEGAWKVFWALLTGLLKTAWALIQAVVKTAWDVVVGIFTIFINLITGRWGAAWNALLTMLKQVWNNIQSVVRAATSAVEGVLSAAWSAIRSVASAAWDGIKSVWNAFWGGIKSIASAAVGGVESVFSAFWGALKRGFSDAVSAIGTIWKGIQNAALVPVRFVVGTVYNHGIVPVVDAIAGVVGLHPLNPIQGFASGTEGAPPGWAWVGERGPELVRFSGGETVLDNRRSMATGLWGAVGGFAAGTTGKGRGPDAKQPAVDPRTRPNIDVSKNPLTELAKGIRSLVGDALGAAIGAILNPLLNAIPGTSTGIGLYVKKDVQKVTADAINWIKGKSNAAAGPGSGPPGGSTGAEYDNAVQGYRYLLANVFGGVKPAAAGAVASIWGESSWNPFAVGTGGRGLIGWTPPSTISDAAFNGGMRTQLPAIISFINSSGDWGVIARMKAAGASGASVTTLAEMWGQGVERYGIDDVHPYGVSLATGIMQKYDNGGRIRENIYGVGASGTPYKFQAGENVQTAEAAALAAKQMDKLLKQMDTLIRTTAAVPAGVGRHVGGQINGVGADAAFNRRYGRG